MGNLADVEPKPVEWFWHNRIPQGKLSALFGDPGRGKSFIAVFLAAQTTTAGPWPDIEMPTVPGSVIMLVGEDGLSDTVRIRADAMGADPSKIHIIDGVKVAGKENTKAFNLTDHLPALENAIVSLKDVRLVIIDPITVFLGANLDSHKDSSTRFSVLVPLSKLAERTNTAIIGIGHFNKSQANHLIYRGWVALLLLQHLGRCGVFRW